MLQLVSSCLILLTVWHIVDARLERASVQIASELRDDLLASYSATGSKGVADRITTRLSAPGSAELAMLLVGPDGDVLAGNLAEWPPTLTSDGRWTEQPLHRKGRLKPELIRLTGRRLPDGFMLVTGHVIDNQEEVMAVIAETLGAVVLFAIALAGLGSLLITRMVDSRVSNLARTASAVAGGSFSERVPKGRGNDVFDRLGASINRMLERIDRLVSELRIVTEGLAHDLRSPLTRLEAHLTDAATMPEAAAIAEPLERARSEARLLLKMVTTALEIGRMEAGVGRETFAPARLDVLIWNLIELYGPAAEEKGFRICGPAENPVTLSVHRELLSQAIGNLIENALTHAEPGDLHVTLVEAQGSIDINVEDSGPGIPERDRALALQPFRRLDAARRHGGAGLGLALVAAIARLHGGVLKLEDGATGLRATISLPDGHSTCT